MNSHPGIPFVIAAPSGAGKTSLVAALLQKIPNLQLSISHTTRPKRSNEQNGVNYHFVDEATFKHMREAGDFIEYAKVYDHYYGTSRTWLMDTLAKGFDVVLEIDWQGARHIKQALPSSVAIFVLPPSTATLQQRLRLRAQDDQEVIDSRMSQAKSEMSHYKEFDFVLINDSFEQALSDLQAILRVQYLSKDYQVAHQKALLSALLAES